MRRLCARPGQRVKAIHQQRPRRFRPDCGVERQQIDFSVPEDMTEISIAGERTRAYRYVVVLGIGGTGKMIRGETQCSLQYLIAVDNYVADRPARIPGGF